jgi:hypothetical protein
MKKRKTVICGIGEKGLSAVINMDKAMLDKAKNGSTLFKTLIDTKLVFPSAIYYSQQERLLDEFRKMAQRENPNFSHLFFEKGEVEKCIDFILHNPDTEKFKDKRLKDLAEDIRVAPYNLPSHEISKLRIFGEFFYYFFQDRFSAYFQNLEELLGRDPSLAPPEFYLVAYLGDGFSSGIFWSIACRLKEMFKDSKIYSFFLVPDFQASGNNDKDNQSENAYAALLELAHFEKFRNDIKFGAVNKFKDIRQIYPPIFHRIYLFKKYFDEEKLSEIILLTLQEVAKSHIVDSNVPATSPNCFASLESLIFKLEQFETIQWKFLEEFWEAIRKYLSLKSLKNSTIKKVAKSCSQNNSEIESGSDLGKNISKMVQSAAEKYFEEHKKNLADDNFFENYLPKKEKIYKWGEGDFQKFLKGLHDNIHLKEGRDYSVEDGNREKASNDKTGLEFHFDFPEWIEQGKDSIYKNKEIKGLLHDRALEEELKENIASEISSYYYLPTVIFEVLEELEKEKEKIADARKANPLKTKEEKISQLLNEFGRMIKKKNEFKPGEKHLIWSYWELFYTKIYQKFETFIKENKNELLDSFNQYLKLRLREDIQKDIIQNFKNLLSKYVKKLVWLSLMLNKTGKYSTLYLPVTKEMLGRVSLAGGKEIEYKGELSERGKGDMPLDLIEYFIQSNEWNDKEMQPKKIAEAIKEAKNQLENKSGKIIEELIKTSLDFSESHDLSGESECKREFSRIIRNWVEKSFPDVKFLRRLLHDPLFLQRSIKTPNSVFYFSNCPGGKTGEQKVFLGVYKQFKTDYDFSEKEGFEGLKNYILYELGEQVQDFEIKEGYFIVLREQFGRSGFQIDGIVKGYKKFIQYPYPRLILLFNKKGELPWEHFSYRSVDFPHLCGNPSCHEDITNLHPETFICPHCTRPIRNRCGHKDCEPFKKPLTDEEVQAKKCPNPKCEKFLRTYWWSCSDHKIDISTDKAACPNCVYEYKNNERTMDQIRKRDLDEKVCPNCLAKPDIEEPFIVPDSLVSFYHNGINGHDKLKFYMEADKHLKDRFFCRKCNRLLIPVYYRPWKEPNANYPDLEELLKKEGREEITEHEWSRIKTRDFHMVYRYKGHPTFEQAKVKPTFICPDYPEKKFYACGNCEYPIPMEPDSGGTKGYLCPRCNKRLIVCHFCSEPHQRLILAESEIHPKLGVRFCKKCGLPAREEDLRILGEKLTTDYENEDKIISLKSCGNIFGCKAGAEFHRAFFQDEEIDKCPICEVPELPPLNRIKFLKRGKECPVCSYYYLAVVTGKFPETKEPEKEKRLTASTNSKENLADDNKWVDEYLNFLRAGEEKDSDCEICGFNMRQFKSIMEILYPDYSPQKGVRKFKELILKLFAVLVLFPDDKDAAREIYINFFMNIGPEPHENIIENLSKYDLRDFIIITGMENEKDSQHVRRRMLKRVVDRRLDAIYSILSEQYFPKPITRGRMLRVLTIGLNKNKE